MKQAEKDAIKLFSIVTRIRNRIFNSIMELKLNDYGLPELTIPQFHALNAIEQLEKPTLSELAEKIAVSNPSASAMIERLVKMNLVKRSRSQKDRRRVELQLTPLAKKALNLIETRCISVITKIMEGIGKKYTKNWISVYEKIDEFLKTETY